VFSPLGAHGDEAEPFTGAFATRVAFEVPAFHGIEPVLGLSYRSFAGAYHSGVGWSIDGFPMIERRGTGGGVPTYAATDVFYLEGSSLVACTPSTVSPSCASGGTHATQIESRRRIVFDAAANRWHVWGPDGVRETFKPIHLSQGQTYRWGIEARVDTLGNEVRFGWQYAVLPSTVTYGDYKIQYYFEARVDPISRATSGTPGQVTQRLKRVLVSGASGLIRAYRLGYSTSPATGRSLVTSIEQLGSDTSVGANGSLSGGSRAWQRELTYERDAGAGALAVGPGAGTPAWSEEVVEFARGRWVDATAGKVVKHVGHGSPPDESMNAGASSSRAIVGGDGFVEFHFTKWTGETLAGLGTHDADESIADVQFGVWRIDNGTAYIVDGPELIPIGGALCCATYRIEIQGGVTSWYQDGALIRTSTRVPSYPLRLDVAMRAAGWSGIDEARIGGALADIALWCGTGRRSQGDFDGDGRTDLLCDTSAFGGSGQFLVRRSTATGFAPAELWLDSAGYAGQTGRWAVADVDGDGRADLVHHEGYSGDFAITRSTGTAFAAAVTWLGNGKCRLAGHLYDLLAGDFDGDGKSDIACHLRNDTGDAGVWVARSTGTEFTHGKWLAGSCAPNRWFGTADFDGNGRSDWYCVGDGAVTIAVSTGTALSWSFSLPPHTLEGAHLIDVNGDGLDDFISAYTGQAYLAAGGRLVAQTAPSPAAPFCTDGQSVVSDLDGDNRADWICNRSGAGANDIEVRAGRGAGLAAPAVWRAGWCRGDVVPADFDGDGTDELACTDGIDRFGWAGTPNVAPDLLVSVTTGLGGLIRAGYAPSTSFVNTDNPPVHQVVTSIERDDGRGGTALDRFTYAGGRYDRQRRSFLGYRYVKRARPCVEGEVVCPFDETWFADDPHGVPRVERLDHRDGQGYLLRSRINDWQTTPGVLPYHVWRAGEWRFDYDGTGEACPTWPCAAGKRTYIGHARDAWHNEIVTTWYGDWDVVGDEHRVERAFVVAHAPFIIDRVAARSVYRAASGGQPAAQTVYHYDGAASWNTAPVRGLVTAERVWHAATDTFFERRFTYDTSGNRTSDRDRLGALHQTEWDAARLLPIRTIDPMGHVETVTWHVRCGRPSIETDANGAAFQSTYDVHCRRTRIDGPDGSWQSWTFEHVGEPALQAVRIDSPAPAGATGSLWRREYRDGFGRVWKTTRRAAAEGAIAIENERAYDARGLVAWGSIPRFEHEPQHRLRYRFDALGRALQVAPESLSDGGVRYAWGAWVVSITDPVGRRTVGTFDADERVTAVDVFDGSAVARTSYTYAPGGDLLTITDAADNVWTWTYDSLGRVVATGDPDHGARSYEFDAEGRLVAETDALARRTTSSYDALGRRTARTTLAGTPGAETTSWVYDEARQSYANVGRLTRTIDPWGEQRIDYDAFGRERRRTRTIGDDAYTFTTTYDAGGRPTERSYPDGDAIAIGYDASGNPATMSGVVDATTYDATGRPRSRTLANGTTTTWTWSASRGWLDAIRTTGPSGVVAELGYTRNEDGTIAHVASPLDAWTWTFSYDGAGRLTDATGGFGEVEESFVYDAIGRLSYSSLAGDYVYPGAGQSRPHAALSVGVAQFAYDSAGQMTSWRGVPITWTGDGRIASVGTEHYAYDADGARLIRIEGNERVISFGDDVDLENGVFTKYLRLGDDIVGKRVGGTTTWFHGDSWSTTLAITDANGAVVHRRAYRPFGETVHEEGIAEQRGWIGEDQDSSGLIDLHARHYDPALGRFLSADPANPLVGGLDRYAYAGNDPVNAADPTGWCRETDRGVECRDGIDVWPSPGPGSGVGAGPLLPRRLPPERRGPPGRPRRPPAPDTQPPPTGPPTEPEPPTEPPTEPMPAPPEDAVEVLHVASDVALALGHQLENTLLHDYQTTIKVTHLAMSLAGQSPSEGGDEGIVTILDLLGGPRARVVLMVADYIDKDVFPVVRSDVQAGLCAAAPHRCRD
jgi:RHS repeat-associated protein